MSPEPKFWRRHCSTGLERNSCMKFCPRFPPPQPTSWRRYCLLVLNSANEQTSKYIITKDKANPAKQLCNMAPAVAFGTISVNSIGEQCVSACEVKAVVEIIEKIQMNALNELLTLVLYYCENSASL